MQNPNNTYNILHTVIQDAKNKYMPSKLVKYNKYKHKKFKWVTFGIIRSIQYRYDLYKKLKMADPISNEFATIKINLNTYNKILKTLIRLAKKYYYEKYSPNKSIKNLSLTFPELITSTDTLLSQ